MAVSVVMGSFRYALHHHAYICVPMFHSLQSNPGLVDFLAEEEAVLPSAHKLYLKLWQKQQYTVRLEEGI